MLLADASGLELPSAFIRNFTGENMQIKVFTVPFYGGERQNEEMNVFLRTHKVVDIEQAFSQEHGWTFCVKYVDSAAVVSADESHGKKNKPDYKEILNEKQFAMFSELRKARKEIAAAEAIPAYAVFTDAELAEFTKLHALDEASMKKVAGVGSQRVANYGKRLIDAYLHDKEAGMTDMVKQDIPEDGML